MYVEANPRNIENDEAGNSTNTPAETHIRKTNLGAALRPNSFCECVFVAGVFVVKGLLDFVSRHGFAPFAWWRIIVGLAGFAGLYFLG